MFSTLIALLATAAFTMIPPAPEATTLVDQTFEILDRHGEDAQVIGGYALHAEQQADRVRITESFALTMRGKAIEMSSTVVYEQNADKAWVLVSAKAATSLDGNLVMQTEIEPKEQNLTVTTTLLRDPRGEAVDNPQPETRTLPLPKGSVLLSGALAVMGPRLLTQAGQLPVVWVEFPDDIDEAINIKQGHTLVRSAPADDGGYTLHLRTDQRDLGPLPLDRNGKVKPHHLFDKYPLREKPGDE